MSKIVNKAQSQIKELVLSAIAEAQAKDLLPAGDSNAFQVEVPADRANGDYSTNAAMVNAKAYRLPPRKIAEAICGNMNLEGTYFERVEIAGPGFINFFLSDVYYADIIFEVREAGDSYGRSILPLMVEDYAKITVIDIRYQIPQILLMGVNFENADVLFLYSTLILNNSSELK